MSSQYSVQCDCGASHPVSAMQAGATIACSCGRSVDVPMLSSLRRSAGETPIPLNTVERIRAMIQNGELPQGDICPYSGRPANETLLLRVECERVWMRGGGSTDFGKMFAFVFLLGWLGLLLAWRKMQPLEERGRDTAINVPVRISTDARGRILRLRRQRALKALLCKTPIYAALLREFPGATVTPIGQA